MKKMKNETLDGPWKVVSCGNDTLAKVLNDLVAEGYLIHSIHPIYKPLQETLWLKCNKYIEYNNEPTGNN